MLGVERPLLLDSVNNVVCDNIFLLKPLLVLNRSPRGLKQTTQETGIPWATKHVAMSILLALCSNVGYKRILYGRQHYLLYSIEEVYPHQAPSHFWGDFST